MTPRRSARAERGAAAVEAAKLRQEEMLKKVEAFRSKEDLAACLSETAFMIMSCKSPDKSRSRSPSKFEESTF